MDSGDGEINGPNQDVQLRFLPLLHLVERFEHYDAVGPEMSLLRDTIMRGLFNEFSLETVIEIFYNTLWLGNIDDIARVDLAIQAAVIGLNPVVGVEGPRDNEVLPVPAADTENNLAGLAEDPWDHQGLHLPPVNVDINLPREADNQFADDMWWVWESDIDSGTENESDLESESDDDVPELIPIIPEPQESRSPPREEADESGLFGSRRRQREETNNGDFNEMNRKRFRFLNSGNEPSDITSESEDNENEDTVSSPSTSADTEAGQKKRKRDDDDDEDNERDKRMCKN